MTTDLAFKILLSERGVHKKLGLCRSTVGKWRHDLKHGYPIRLDTKIRYLKKGGFDTIQDMLWTLEKVNIKKEEPLNDYLTAFPGLTLIGKKAGLADETIRQINKSIIEDPVKFIKIYKKMIS